MKTTVLIATIAFLAFPAFTKVMPEKSLSIAITGSIQETKLPDSRIWLLTAIETDSSFKKALGKNPFLRFDTEKGSVGGNGSCNSFGGTYTMIGDSIHISRLFSTKMFCQDVQETETRFLQLLEKVNLYKINGNRMTFYHDQTSLLEFISA